MDDVFDLYLGARFASFNMITRLSEDKNHNRLSKHKLLNLLVLSTNNKTRAIKQ